MAKATDPSRRCLRRDLSPLPALFWLNAFRDCTTGSTDCTRHATNAIHSRDRSEVESARTGDRLALLSSRDFIAPLRKFAVGRRAHHGLQSVRAPDFSRWRGGRRRVGLSIRGENKKAPWLAELPLRHGRAANFGK